VDIFKTEKVALALKKKKIFLSDVTKGYYLLYYSSVQQKRSYSPELSFVSMKSDQSMDPVPDLKGGDTPPNHRCYF